MPLPKLTPELTAALCEAIRIGVPLAVAARRAGVSARAAEDWMQRGRGTHPKMRATKLYVDFVDAVEKARAESTAALVARIRQAGQGGQEFIEEQIEYEAGPMVDGQPTQVVKRRRIFKRKTEKDWHADAWLLEKTNPEIFGKRAALELTGALGTYVIEAPAPEDDIDAWRRKYTPLASQQQATSSTTNGHANGSALNGHANGAGHGNGNGHAGGNGLS